MISILITETYKKAYTITLTLIIDNFTLLLERVLCIHYLMRFKKDQAKVQVLINSDNKVNVMILAYTAKLGFKARSSNIKIQKINNSIFKMFEIVLASF